MPQGSKQIQTQAQQQVQTLSPQQILLVKLIELPTVELEDRVHAEILENPALEEGKDEPADELADTELSDTPDETEGDTSYNSLDDYRDEDDIPDYRLQEHNRSADDQVLDIPFSAATSFYESLINQLSEHNLSESELELGKYLIGSLDDDGLLRKPVDSLADELSIYMGIETTPETLLKVLHVIQQFDPAGIGARSLQECLLLQIKRKKEQSEHPSPLLQTEIDILTDCYEEFTRKHWDKIRQKLMLDEDTFDRALKEIVRLNPRPGASMGETIGKNYQQIIPDFLVDTDDNGTILLSLNGRNVPDLRISPEFSEMLRNAQKDSGLPKREQKEAMAFLKQKVDAAQGFIDAVRQRQYTLLTTMQAIIDLQRPFFIEGDESLLKPMILKDVAEKARLDISTVSRVSNSKYVQTNFGIYPLKFFFNDSYVKDNGEELSVREIKRLLQETIEGEDRQKPYTDDELGDILSQKGYPIARRTVAKYRQQLNLPVARLRK